MCGRAESGGAEFESRHLRTLFGTRRNFFFIIEGVMSHDPIAMVYTAARAVRLYVSIAVNLRSFLGVPPNAILSPLTMSWIALGAF